MKNLILIIAMTVIGAMTFKAPVTAQTRTYDDYVVCVNNLDDMSNRSQCR